VDTPPDNRLTLALRRGVVAILSAGRRVLASVFQTVFKDRLRDISEKTDRLGSASVESVTYLGGEVRSLDQRLDRIERELASLRELLEARERSSESAEDPAELRR
jgi:predicted nuclease with TOPRIM domain